MKIAILSRSPKAYSTRSLLDAARSRGHTVDVLDTFRFGISLETEFPDLYYGGEPLETEEGDGYDAVVPRIGASVTYFGTAVVRQFEQMGVYCVNSALGINNSRDKLRSLQILSRHEVGIPPTAFVRARSDVLPAIRRVGGAPVIIKLLEGTQGVGVILADTEKMAETIFETLQSARQNVLIQKFVSESKGKDVRAFVVGDRVVAAMRRVAQAGEFRSNVHRGGRTEAVELSPVFERTAVRAAHILGLQVAGVDMLEGADGPQIMEVNSSPGLEGIETATGVDVAGAIIGHIEEHGHFPDLDVRERLTLSRDYRVTEIHVTASSDLVGRTLRESGLREKDIVVLRITRGTTIISNPKGTRTIEVDDWLLCFGKRDTLAGMLQPKKKRRKRAKSQPS